VNKNPCTATSDSTIESSDQSKTFFRRAVISWLVSSGTACGYGATREVLRLQGSFTITTATDWILAFVWNGFDAAVFLVFVGVIAFKLQKSFVSLRNVGTVGFVAAIICYSIGVRELVGKGVEYAEKATIGGIYGSFGGIVAILVYLIIPSTVGALYMKRRHRVDKETA